MTIVSDFNHRKCAFNLRGELILQTLRQVVEKQASVQGSLHNKKQLFQWAHVELIGGIK